MNKYENFVGKVLDSRYKILELVGMGGMACVLKAQDLVMNRTVAIKILNDEYNGDEQAEARFLDESKAVAMLSNKNIVSVYDVAIYPDIKYIVMEFLDGITLREYLDNKHAIGWKEACIYILQILRALEHAHSKGIIHRDIKPQNVMLMKNGDIKVTDFGIAKLPQSVEGEKTTEKAVGTVYYISPEQACGKETDYYSDIYSVGIMLYEAVTGTLPFVAETPMEVAMMQVNDDPVNPRDIVLDIPVGVSQIILKALEKAPEERFGSAHSMAKAIEWVLRNPDVIFSMTSSGAEESPIANPSVVSIDMIDTAEIEPYKDEEIAVTLGKKHGSKADSKKKDKKSAPNKKKQETPSRTMFPIICGVSLAFLLVAIVCTIFIVFNVADQFFHPNTVDEAQYPHIVDKIYNQELVNDLKDGKSYNSNGVKYEIGEIVYTNDPNIENNKILATDPEGGTSGKPNEKNVLKFRTITVNRSEKVIIPELSGYSKNEAESILLNLGLKIEKQETDNTMGKGDLFFNDQVVSTTPGHNDEVKVGETVTIYYYVRKTSDVTAKMPDCTGMTREQAAKFAKYCKYEYSFVEQETPDGNNTVISQSIKAGTVSKAKTEVVFTISVPQCRLPNFEGLTVTEAYEALRNTAPGCQIYFETIYLTGSEDLKEIAAEKIDLEKTYIEVGFDANINELAKVLVNVGFTQIPSGSSDSVIVLQSVKANSQIKSGDTVKLLLIHYTEAEQGGETSTDDPGISDPEITDD